MRIEGTKKYPFILRILLILSKKWKRKSYPMIFWRKPHSKDYERNTEPSKVIIYIATEKQYKMNHVKLTWIHYFTSFGFLNKIAMWQYNSFQNEFLFEVVVFILFLTNVRIPRLQAASGRACDPCWYWAFPFLPVDWWWGVYCVSTNEFAKCCSTYSARRWTHQ